MSAPKEFIITVSTPASVETGVKIQSLRRGQINKLRVVQTSGTLGGFSYVLYNTSAACPPGPNPTANAFTGAWAPPSAKFPAEESLYRVTPMFTVASGKKWVDDPGTPPESNSVNMSYQYSTLDSDDPTTYVLRSTPSSSSQSLYMKLTPAGTGDKTFAVAITFVAPMLGA